VPITPFWKRWKSRRRAKIATNASGKLREPLIRINGVREVKVDLGHERVIVTFDARKTHAPDLHDAILKSGYKPARFPD